MLSNHLSSSGSASLLLLLLSAAGVNSQTPPARCTTHLLIDDFNTWADGVNTLKGATSDDATLNSTNTSNGILTFTPANIDTSYIYEQFDPIDALSLDYNAISFAIKGPEAASVSIELQTRAVNSSSTDPGYESYYFTIDGLAGSLQTVNVPLSSWKSANLNSVVGVLWYGFSAGVTGLDTEWQLDNLQLLCAGLPAPGDPVVTPTPTPTPTTSASTVSTPTSTSNSGGGGGVTTVTVTVTPTTTTGRPTHTTSTRRPTTRPTPRPTTSYWPWDPWGEDPWDNDDDDDDDDEGSWGWGKQVQPSEEETAAAVTAALSPNPNTPTKASSGKRADTTAAATCELALIDDWASQSRLTFLYYNAMLKPSSDDGTMKSVVVNPTTHRVTLTPSSSDSYFYTQLGCFDARSYAGVSLRITAPSGIEIDVQLSSSKTSTSCNGESTTDATLSSQALGWTFNGREQLYTIPFAKFGGLDYSRFTQVILSGFRKPVTLGPMAIYCANSSASEYIPPPIIEPLEPTATVPAPSSTSTSTSLVIDTFSNSETNALGQWHGTDDDTLRVTYRNSRMTLQTNDSDLSWVTQVSATCLDLRPYAGSYLHVAFSGSDKFSIALQQHNAQCDNDLMPYPETWDSLEASRYTHNTSSSSSSDLYIPLSHFSVDLSRSIGFAFKGFYTTSATVFSKIELVSSVPAGFTIPVKLPSGTFVFACKRPNSFAFAIDDGDPAFAQQVMRTIDAAGFKATFFTVGAPLLDPSTNLSNVYKEMASKGHQIALHSYTHPPLEGLVDEASIDWEYTNDLSAVSKVFGPGVATTKYFRPPFGTEGARMRQRYAALVPDPYIVEWSVDIEDWLWAETSTPEKQIDAFKRDVAAGGSITVMHYLYNSTVSYLPQFIEIAKATGKQLMRVDQCMMDPDAPPL
ncbi:hypothetical protein F5Y17DRAFT_382876 [Xylariaceae sp. FL0594]|nr:hypothetical protein F5Y17DRAFT_382876 [Xylariaceae sp. FL0594]